MPGTVEKKFVGVNTRILADKSKATFFVHAGETLEINPESPDGKNWPAAGIVPTDDGGNEIEWPKYLRIPVSTVQLWEEKGIATLNDRDLVHSPAGPPDNPWKGSAATRRNHEFVTAKSVTFYGDAKDKSKKSVTYNVVRNPGKYYVSDQVEVTKETIGRYGEPSEVVWVYDLERVNA